MPRKSSDPRLIAPRDAQAKAQAEYDRWYSRLKRAFTRLDTARRTDEHLLNILSVLVEETKPPVSQCGLPGAFSLAFGSAGG